jgi:hypothetical protein
MSRVFIELSGFFFLPFIAYALFLIWREKHPLQQHFQAKWEPVRVRKMRQTDSIRREETP